jgi:predicted lipase
MHVSTVIAVTVSFMLFLVGILSIVLIVANEESVRYSFFNPIKWGHDKLVFNHRSKIDKLPLSLVEYDSFNLELSSYCAYLIENVYAKQMNVKGTVLHKRVNYNRSDSLPFAYVLTKGNVIYIPFRGTGQLVEWLNNVETNQDNYTLAKKSYANTPSFMRSNHGIMIHHGFLGTYNRLSSQIIGIVETLMRTNPDYRICITGHSMGGSVAAIFAAQFHFMGYQNTVCYLLGTPRTGNDAFADYIDNCENLNMYAIMNTEDIFPQAVPAVSPNMSQHDKPYFYSFCGQTIYFTENWYSNYHNHSIVVYSKAVETDVHPVDSNEREDS